MTTEQAKGYQAHLSAASKALGDRTLMTKEMRDAIALEKAAKRAFTQCDIRVRFPDGTQIQGTFSAEETVGDIYSFVREQLQQQVPFSLRISPPLFPLLSRPGLYCGCVDVYCRFGAEGGVSGFKCTDWGCWICRQDVSHVSMGTRRTKSITGGCVEGRSGYKQCCPGDVGC
jgi:hypothetical protein